jgi:tetratricopeptide (TPR) repeat protein
MLFRIWSIIRFGYLHICYFCLGLDDEEFLISKANYCMDIGWYGLAIKTYKKALNESSDPRIYSALGWCYSELRMDEESVKHYRIAFEKQKSPENAIGLAYAEYSIGNMKAFKNICQYLNSTKVAPDFIYKNDLIKLNKLLEKVIKTSS